VGGERQFAPTFDELARAIAWNGRVAAEKDAVHPDLAHSSHQLDGVLFPHAVDWNTGRVEPQASDPRILPFDRLRVDAQGLIDYRVVAAAPGKMSNLNGDVWSCRQQAIKEDARLLPSVRPAVIDVRS